MASVGGNIGDGRVVFDTTCFKGECLGEGDGRGEGESVEALGANVVDKIGRASCRERV